MITCYLNYIIEPKEIKEFEHYAKLWIPLVNKFGGTHHGYFLPSEGSSNVALALFSFPSLAEYERYRNDSLKMKIVLELLNMQIKQIVLSPMREVFLDLFLNKLKNRSF